MRAPMDPHEILKTSKTPEGVRIISRSKERREILDFRFDRPKPRHFHTLVIYKPRKATRGGAMW